MSGSDIQFFFQMREQIKLYHWQTKSYARHKATDSVIDSLDEHIDKYVEVYMGKYGRPRMTPRTNTIKVGNLSEASIVKFIKTCINVLVNDLARGLKSTDTDLVNIRDEMLGELNQLLYLFITILGIVIINNINIGIILISAPTFLVKSRKNEHIIIKYSSQETQKHKNIKSFLRIIYSIYQISI